MKRFIIIMLCAALMLMSVCTAAAGEITDDYSEDLDAVTTGVQAGTPFTITASAAVLMERSTGKIVLSKNPKQHLAMASVTKVMSLLLVMEAIDEGILSLDSIVTVSEYAAGMGGSQAYMEVGEQMSVDDMLKCAVVSSCNDATVALAEKVCGNAEAFVEKMNERAKELGMNDTHFVNCTGLDAQGHYSCAEDIAVMSRELMKHEKIFDYTGIWMDTVRDGKFGLSNTNKLLKVYPGITGLKTGSTANAKYCISATAKREGTEFIAVVLGAETSKDRFTDAAKLLDYGFVTYKVLNYNLDELAPIEVVGGKKDTVKPAAVKTTASVLVKRGEKQQITAEISVPGCLYAPIAQGDKIGTVTYKLGDEIIEECDVLANESVEKKTYFDYLFETLKIYFFIR